MVLRYRPSARYSHRVVSYFLKLAVWEPFRYAERLVDRVRAEARVLPQDPVFILGYYRSGTTHLQELLMQDPSFGYMNFFQCFFSTAFNSTERWIKPIFERIIRASGFLHPAHQIPFSFELPGEEDVSLVSSGWRLAANWGQIFPQSFREIYAKTGLLEGISDEELAEFKATYHDLIWRVSKANGHKRLLLKSPPNTGRLALLAEMYPNAKFLFIRRDPYDVFASNKKLWNSFSQTWFEDVDAQTSREHILWSYERSHAAYERDKGLLAPGRLFEVSFEDFIRSPLDTAEAVYEALDLGDFHAVEGRFSDFIDRAHKSSAKPYSLSDQEVDAVNTGLGKWLIQWAYAFRGLRRAA